MGFIHSVEHLGYVRHACSSHNSNSVTFCQIYQIVYIADQFNDQRNYCTIEVPPLTPAVQAAIYGCYSCSTFMGL